MKTITVISLGILLFVIDTECQSNIESMFNKANDNVVESFKVDEWQRYVDFHRKKIQKNLSKKEKLLTRKRSMKSLTKKNVVAPNFILSRTQDGFVVKQLEPGSDSSSIGGFEFPEQPALMRNVKYKFDGSVSPVVKLSETSQGVVGKKLEYGFAANPGVNWKGRSGSIMNVKSKNSFTINQNGEVNKELGISKHFPTGSISLRGTLKVLNASSMLESSEIKEIEPLDSTENYDVETEQYKDSDESFETLDDYYEYPNDNYDENEEDESNIDVDQEYDESFI